MKEKITIYMCSNEHHFLSDKECPFCSEKPIKEIEYREGDCIHCGLLCPEYAYGCANPKPIKIIKTLSKENGRRTGKIERD